MYDEILNEIKKSFIQHQAELFEEYFSEKAPLTLQWLPPYAWYFGGSMKLTNVNNPVADASLKDAFNELFG